jgi:hypothetical protein
MSQVIQYTLDKSGGFFSRFFFMLNHYIYSKKNGFPFLVNTNDWLFKCKDGWTDYFEPISNIDYDRGNCFITDNTTSNVIENYKINEYKLAIPNVYVYNEQTKQKILETKQNLGLFDMDYGSIFIRRGDKLLSESKLYSTDIYVKLLLEKYPMCKTIFLQTDDYNCVLDSLKYI